MIFFRFHTNQFISSVLRSVKIEIEIEIATSFISLFSIFHLSILIFQQQENQTHKPDPSIRVNNNKPG